MPLNAWLPGHWLLTGASRARIHAALKEASGA
jgi:hypothetical protein